MVMSMTGFGRGESKTEKYSFTVEIKTINHRYLDINIKLPRRISFLEEWIRQIIKKDILRGRVEVFIKMDMHGQSESKLSLDTELVKNYNEILHTIKKELNIEEEISLSTITRFPDIIKTTENEIDSDEIKIELLSGLNSALRSLKDMRELEGRELVNDINNRLKILSGNIDIIERLSSTVEEDYRQRLKLKMEDILKSFNVQPDEQRLLQEAAIYADKSSITEEIVRFRSHILQLEGITLNSGEAIGRKLDFLIQEMNREANTIGSKSSNIEITSKVVDIKSELEKIREQIQNIE
ncbi:uncharacterized protein (TIGR00255 family) [Acetoanaerobium pronyense]|uniref:Uncharacterized protein (TIGR00255 family) n=1 Tax=Acetoanaerobium pronyense TaxID=1482736 RepID=A0ABS4KHP0_9FIRM|nr:YicC/YloC family endoribonuclease [Acetoanaerobium pronyense]MBP2026641.1 uncharacterized protein (TIGR00255 family) [Acetoanaerobium pronyense]